MSMNLLTTFWGGFSERVGDRWATTIVTPAFAFWTGGLILSLLEVDRHTLQQQLLQLSQAEQFVLLIVTLVTVLGSASIVQTFENPVLRLMAGGWPRWMRRIGLFWEARKLRNHQNRLQELSTSIESLPPDKRTYYAHIDYQVVRLAPIDEHDWMPTRVGNILRATETRVKKKYGLEPSICLPRLWLVMPDSARIELATVRSSLNATALICCWGLLFPIWAYYNLWAIPIACLVVYFGYRRAVSAVEVYGDVLESAFDIYYGNLYTAMRWPLPETSDSYNQGEELTRYLYRGITDTHIRLIDNSSKSCTIDDNP